MRQIITVWHLVLVLTGILTVRTISAQAPYRVHPAYEDSIRIAILWNDAQGNPCGNSRLHQPVGEKTLSFVVQSLDTSRVRNVKFLKNSTNDRTTWSDIEALWGADKLPHNIVHINAGWSVGWNAMELDTIFSRAVARKIGIVSIGDDAASLATTTFGFNGVENVPDPLGDGTTIDSLWIGLLRENDDKLKMYVADSMLQYPGVNGIISNTVDSILDGDQMPFFPYGQGRCQADADKYTILYPQWITMLGYQQGYNNRLLNGPNELNVLVAIQDTVNEKLIRRAVALSFQPQFLRDIRAAQQIIYDAVMFTSLTHTLSVASKIVLTVDSDSVKAGEKVNVSATLFDQHNKPILDKYNLITWQIVNVQATDSLTGASGETTQFSSTRAWRSVTIRAHFKDPETGVSVSATTDIYIKPGDPHHVDVSRDSIISTTMLTSSEPPVTVLLDTSDDAISVFSFVRDRFDNYVRPVNNNGTWYSANVKIVRVSGNGDSPGTGIITKVNSGATTVRAGEGDLIPDTISVVSVVEIDRNSITITVYPNPAAIGTNTLSQIPDRTREFYTNIMGNMVDGILISIYSKKGLVQNGESYARVLIFDAVGNLVVKNLQVRQAASRQYYGCVWNGTSDQGRRVGAGTYLVLLKGTGTDGAEFKVQRKIGIKNIRN